MYLNLCPDIYVYICKLNNMLCLLFFRYVPYVGIVTILMNDYPKFKVCSQFYICSNCIFNNCVFNCLVIALYS